MTRPETGIMQFGDDWPGVFIRGDYSLATCLVLEQAIELFDTHAPNDVLLVAQLRGLLSVLRMCEVTANQNPAIQKLKPFSQCLATMGIGSKVRTCAVPDPSSDWTPESLCHRKWDIEGYIVAISNSHGLIYQVLHMDGSLAWYEPRELKMIDEYK